MLEYKRKEKKNNQNTEIVIAEGYIKSRLIQYLAFNPPEVGS
jgi:hypothetical protein